MGRQVPTGAALSARRGFFWVGVEATWTELGAVPAGAMYVEWLAPEQVLRPHPVVLVHGGGGQGLDWLGTPDGRPGWAPLLVDAGFVVYVVDRPGHGRSPYHPDVLGPMTPPASYEQMRGLFVDGLGGTADFQWPGAGVAGDATMDQFMAGTGPMRADVAAAHGLEQRRLAELLDRVGPALLFSHSAGGPAGFLAVDARPEQVAALVAIEPLGPPFLDRPGLALPWGLAAAPLTFAPAAAQPADLHDGTRRALPNLAGTPMAVVSAARSPLAAAAADVVTYLRDAGCDAEALRLEEHGIAGNGHGMMLERNNADVLSLLVGWLERTGVA